MSLILRGGVYHIRAMVDGVRIQQSTKTGDKKLAQAIHSNVLAKAVLGLHGMAKPECPTLGDAIKAALRSHYAGQKSLATVLINAATVEEYFGSTMRLNEITEEKLGELVGDLRAKGLAAGTINRKLAVLSTILKLNHKALGSLPTIPLQEEYKGRIRYLTGSEEMALLAFVDERVGGSPTSPQWIALRRLLVVLLDTGMRLGEALALKWSALDQDLRVIHIWESKGDISRTIPLTDRAYWALQEQGYDLFSVLTKDATEHRWQTLRKDMGLEHDSQFVIHALRHTCCTRLIKAGNPLMMVQMWMGHKNIQTTMRYAHLDSGDLHACRDSLQQGVVKLNQ